MLARSLRMTVAASWLALAAGSIPAAAQPMRSAGSDHPAVALFTPAPVLSPYSPLATVSCRVRVAVHVDELGRVSRVVVRGITPSGEHDREIRELIEDQLADWRFAPAREESRPVASILQWTIQLSPLGRAARGDAKGGPAGQSSGTSFATNTRRRNSFELRRRQRELVGRLKQQQRVELLNGSIRFARSVMNAEKTTRIESARFILWTDIGETESARQLVRNFEAIYSSVYDEISQGLPAYTATGKMLTFVFASRREYTRFVGAYGVSPKMAGVYVPLGFLAFHAQMPSASEALAVQIHETTHALFDRHLLASGVELPTWLSEGVAEYFGLSDVRRGRIVPGSHKNGRFFTVGVMAGGDLVTFLRQNRKSLGPRELRARVRKGELPSIDDLLHTARTTYYGKEAQLYYSMGWMFVHFLRHGTGENSKEKFQTFLLYALEGFPIDRTLEKVYGRSIDALDQEFRTYVKRF